MEPPEDILSDELFVALMSIPEFNPENEVFNLDLFDADFPDLSDSPHCENCNGTSWDYDYLGCLLVCSGCGACMGGVTRAIAERGDFCAANNNNNDMAAANHHELAAVDPEAEHIFRAKNHVRRAYIREKFSQWFMSESPIPADDWSIIERAYINYCETVIKIPGFIPTGDQLRRAKGKQIDGQPVLDKQDIQIILSDAEAVAQLDGRTGPFAKRYIEKWRTIRWRFCGVASSISEIPPDLLNFLMHAFDQLDQAFPKAVGDPLKRKKFPHYDTIIYRLLELKGCAELGKDLEEIKTRRGKKSVERCWWLFCKYFKWPYISRDEKILTDKMKF